MITTRVAAAPGLRSALAALHTAPMLAAAFLSLSLSLPAYARPAYRLATSEVREAIDDAYAAADPQGKRPWWRAELYLICARESRCGRDGRVGVHEGDSRSSDRAWKQAIAAGKLDVDCQEHAWLPGEWSTRGLFGMIAAYHVGWLGCVGPWVMDDPRVAAHLAVQQFVACNAKRRGECTCVDHTKMWVGAGVWASRPLLGEPSRYRSVERQCGKAVAEKMVRDVLGPDARAE